MIEVLWTGQCPCLCSGEWVLKINGTDYSNFVPFGSNPADTFGEFSKWSFNDDYDEVWSYYEDGLIFEDWLDENKDWLQELPLMEFNLKELYNAFSEQDWRPSSCGGCI